METIKTKPSITLKRYDYMMIAVLAGMLLIRALTILAMQEMHQITGVDIEKIIEVTENNPIAKLQLVGSQVKYMFFFIISPSIVAAVYMIFRHHVKEGKMHIDSLRFYVYVSFFIICNNLLNDAVQLIGVSI